MRVISYSLSTFGSGMLPAPAVQAFFYIPRIQVGRWVVFMVDTGASGTCLHGACALSLQRHMRPSTLDEARGVGGKSQYFGERALLIFRDNTGASVSRTLNRLDIMKITSADVAKDGDILRVPCLLGRDILNNWRLVYGATESDVQISAP